MSVVRLLRELHLLTGLFCAPFLALYAVSALEMSLPGLVPLDPTEERVVLALPAGASLDEVLARVREAGAAGRPAVATQSDTAVDVQFERPALRHSATVDRRTGQGTLTIERGNFLGFLNRLHHAAGVGPGDPGSRLWGAVVIATSLGAILLGVGGILLWLPRLAERRTGLVFLASSTAIGLALLVWIRHAV